MLSSIILVCQIFIIKFQCGFILRFVLLIIIKYLLLRKTVNIRSSKHSRKIEIMSKFVKKSISTTSIQFEQEHKLNHEQKKKDTKNQNRNLPKLAKIKDEAKRCQPTLKLKRPKQFIDEKKQQNLALYQLNDEQIIRQQKYKNRIKQFLGQKQNYDHVYQQLKLDQFPFWFRALSYVDCTKLKILSLNTCFLTQFHICILAETKWPNLVQIRLDNNKIKSDGVKELMSINMPHLSSIFLDWNFIQDTGFAQILKKMRKIKKLGLSANKISDWGMLPLIKINLSALSQLDLSSNQISLLGIKILTKLNCRGLKKLSLKNTKIDNQGVKILTKGAWPELAFLQLSNSCHFSSYNCLYAADNCWKKMNHFSIGHNTKNENIVLSEPILLMQILPSRCLRSKAPLLTYTMQWAWKQMSSLISDINQDY